MSQPCPGFELRVGHITSNPSFPVRQPSVAPFAFVRFPFMHYTWLEGSLQTLGTNCGSRLWGCRLSSRQRLVQRTHRSCVLKQHRKIWARALHRPPMVTRPSLTLKDFWMTVLRLTSFIMIIRGVIFGAKQSYFPIGASRILGREVDEDLKLPR